MVYRHYRLPSLTSLAAFEASARHRSIKRAAEELNVTPGAVSRQIKGLEEELGVLLFGRSQSGLMLTADAEALYVVLANAFSRTAEAVQMIRAGNQSMRVTLACTHAVATHWLMPRMGDFWRRHPEINVDHLISDDTRDFRRSEVDLRIRYGFGAWPDETSTILMSEKIYPVAGPTFAKKYADCTADDIPQLPLLHVEWVDAEWTGWDEFLHRASIAHGALVGRRFSTFSVALQACQENQGIAVGWERLIHDVVAEGKVVPFTGLRMPSPGSYYLTWNANREISPAAKLLRDWLLETAAILPD